MAEGDACPVLSGPDGLAGEGVAIRDSAGEAEALATDGPDADRGAGLPRLAILSRVFWSKSASTGARYFEASGKPWDTALVWARSETTQTATAINVTDKIATSSFLFISFVEKSFSVYS